MDYFNDLTILDVSRCVTKRNGYPMKNPNYTIGIMLKGPAIRHYEGHSLILETLFLYWSSPHTPVSAWRTPPNVERENLWVNLTGKRAERMLEALDKLPNGKFGNHVLYKTEKLCEIFERLRICFLRKLPAEKYHLPLLVEEFMAAVGESVIDGRRGEKINGHVEKIALKMYETPEKDFDMEMIAEEAGVSKEYFRHCFREQMGISFHRYLLSQRYALAVKLLQESSLSVGEISERCGFAAQREFTLFFKKRSGYSPAKFRKYSM